MGEDTFAALDAAIAGASAAERPALVVQLAGRLATLGASLAAAEPTAAPSGDRNLDIDQAAARLGMSAAWLYRNGGGLPFAIRIGRRLLFSEQGIERYLERRRS